jgi:hypothetical protein
MEGYSISLHTGERGRNIFSNQQGLDLSNAHFDPSCMGLIYL